MKEVEIPECVKDRGTEWLYLTALSKGASERFAEMAAMQCAPGIGVTDDVFISDQNRHGRSILDRMGGDRTSVELLRKALARNGYALKSDDHYIPTVARFHGDPEAVVSHGQGLSDLQKRLEKRNVNVEGEINLTRRATGPVKIKHKLHPRIVERNRMAMIAENPDLAHVNQQELREQIIDKHGTKKETV